MLWKLREKALRRLKKGFLKMLSLRTMHKALFMRWRKTVRGVRAEGTDDKIWNTSQIKG